MTSNSPQRLWQLSDMPNQTGHTVLITGPTSGIGYHVALEFARRGARVVLGARNRDKLAATSSRIRDQVPQADLHPLPIDVADLTDVRRAAAAAAELGPIDVLVNNAGVMATPFARSVDGFDLQMATNHFGHFLLTGLLLPQLVASGRGRVVAVGSQAHNGARTAPVGDPRQHAGRYHRMGVYAQSKLANIMFAFELDRRLTKASLPVLAMAAHPGYAATKLLSNGQTRGGQQRGAAVWDRLMGVLSQPAAMGALPLLMAATADLPGGSYVGPSQLAQSRGLPTLVPSTKLARNESVAGELWEMSERATGVAYP